MAPIKKLQRYVDLLDKKKKLDEEIDIARNVAMDEMRKAGLKQIKTADHTASIAVRITKQINEPLFRNWASAEPGIELDAFYDTLLNNKRVGDFSSKWIQDTGEILPFVSATETEYISIRSNK